MNIKEEYSERTLNAARNSLQTFHKTGHMHISNFEDDGNHFKVHVIDKEHPAIKKAMAAKDTNHPAGRLVHNGEHSEIHSDANKGKRFHAVSEFEMRWTGHGSQERPHAKDPSSYYTSHHGAYHSPEEAIKDHAYGDSKRAEALTHLIKAGHSIPTHAVAAAAAPAAKPRLKLSTSGAVSVKESVSIPVRKALLRLGYTDQQIDEKFGKPQLEVLDEQFPHKVFSKEEFEKKVKEIHPKARVVITEPGHHVALHGNRDVGHWFEHKKSGEVYEEILGEGYESKILEHLKEKGIRASFSHGILRVEKGKADEAEKHIEAHPQIHKVPEIVSEDLMEGRGRPRKDGTKSGEDEADQNIMTHLRKAQDGEGKHEIPFVDGKKHAVHPHVAKTVLNALERVKPDARFQLQQHVHKNHENLMSVYNHLVGKK